MQKRSVLVKILVLVLIAIAIPAMLSATPSCEPPYCQGACPDNTYDCTEGWLMASWSNFQTALGLWFMGYSILICCNN